MRAREVLLAALTSPRAMSQEEAVNLINTVVLQAMFQRDVTTGAGVGKLTYSAVGYTKEKGRVEMERCYVVDGQLLPQTHKARKDALAHDLECRYRGAKRITVLCTYKGRKLT